MTAKKGAKSRGKPERKAPPKTPVWKITPDQQIVGAVFLAAGDMIRIKGHTTDLTQKVEHMEVAHKTVPSASPGDGVGIKVADRARVGDAVYKV